VLSSPFLRVTLGLDYAIRTMIVLAGRPDEYTPIPAIAVAAGLPENSVRIPLVRLHHAEIVDRRLGQLAGWRLRDAPERLTLATIVSAIQGTWDTDRFGAVTGQDAMHRPDIWERLEHTVRRELDRVTLRDLLEDAPATLA
jgi:DNA-binding IscR family transcriptional regulator